MKPYSALTEAERHPALACSVCSEDQKTIELPGVAPFQLCKVTADDVEAALQKAMADGFLVEEVIGYRRGRTKGPLDRHGRRTLYSNHSFGLALDINPKRNGLYDGCVSFSSACRLLRGGEWRPGEAGAVTPETSVYKELTAIGWHWGGELEGRQKDFMHFSPDGD